MTTDFLHGVEVISVDDEAKPVRTVKSSVIGLIGTSAQGPVNTPVLLSGRRRKGVQTFGVRQSDGFSIPESLDGIFDQAGASVVVINVCDPSVHFTAVSDEALTLDANGRATLSHPYVTAPAVATAVSAPIKLEDSFAIPEGVTVTALKSEDGKTTFVKNTDYTLSADSLTRKGSAIEPSATVLLEYSATLVSGTDFTLDSTTGNFVKVSDKILPTANLTIDYNYTDASKVTETDVVGQVLADGRRTGVHALLDSASVVHLTPRILAAPYFTHQRTGGANAVVSELVGIAEQLRAVIVADGPNTSDEDAITYRKDWGSPRVYVVDPWMSVAAPGGGYKHQPSSARVAGLISKVDVEQGFWFSPSNHILNGAVATSRGIDFALSDVNSRANYLNENLVATIISESGFRLWGNRSTDGGFLVTQRTKDMIHESLMLAHLWAVDRGITKKLVEEIVESVRDYLRSLQARGAILGGTAWADPELNTDSVIQAGQLFIDFEFTPVYPAERITFRSHLVNDYVREIFD